MNRNMTQLGQERQFKVYLSNLVDSMYVKLQMMTEHPAQKGLLYSFKEIVTSLYVTSTVVDLSLEPELNDTGWRVEELLESLQDCAIDQVKTEIAKNKDLYDGTGKQYLYVESMNVVMGLFAESINDTQATSSERAALFAELKDGYCFSVGLQTIPAESTSSDSESTSSDSESTSSDSERISINLVSNITLIEWSRQHQQDLLLDPSLATKLPVLLLHAGIFDVDGINEQYWKLYYVDLLPVSTSCKLETSQNQMC